MDVVFYSPDKFDDLKNWWNKLEMGEEMTAFQSHSWYYSVNELYKREKRRNIFRDWFYAVAFDNGEPVMIAPLQFVKCGVSYRGIIGTNRGIYFIGRQGYTDYLNFIYRDFSKEAVNSIINAVKEKYKTGFFCLEFIPENTSLSKFLSSNYCKPYSTNACAEIILPESFEEHKSHLSKSVRQNIRTAFNRQKRDNMNFTHEATFEPLPIEVRDELMKIRKGRVIQKKATQKKNTTLKGKLVNLINAPAKSFFSVPHNIMYEELNSWCFLVKRDEEIVSFYWGIKDLSNSKFYIIYVGINEKYAWYSPNNSHFYQYIEELYTEGKQPQVFDFTRGGEKYKFDIGCTLKNGTSFRFKLK